jgi:hypothetical protein
MENIKVILDDACLMYAFAQEPFPEMSRRVEFAGGVLSATARTDVAVWEAEDRGVLIVGVCVDTHGEWPIPEIGQKLLEGSTGLSELIPLADRLAGRYVILYREGANLYVLPDATCSMPVYYDNRPGRRSFAAAEFPIAETEGLTKSELARRVHRAGRDSHPLPGTMTYYSEITILTANHYLDCQAPRAVRFFPLGARLEPLSMDEAAERIEALTLENIRQLMKIRQFEYPLTAGKDSRLSFALFRKVDPTPDAYTFCRNNAAFLQTPDATVPPQLCESLGCKHVMIPQEKAPEAYQAICRRVLGDDFLPGQADWPYMFQKRYPGKSLYGSGILDCVGKICFVGRGLPSRFATTIFLSSRSDFYTAEGRRCVRDWLRETKADKTNLSLFDLYTWEWRCSRWMPRHPIVFAAMGVEYISMYNSREILLTMMRTSRPQRSRAKLHEAMFRRLDKAYTDIPFNPKSGFHKLLNRLKRPSVYHLIAMYARYPIYLVKHKGW